MNKKEYNKSPKLCLSCNNKIPYNKKENIYCNNSCSATLTNKKRTIQRKICLSCSKRVNNSRAKYCSIVCQKNYEWSLYKCEIEEKQNANPRNVKNCPTIAKKYILQTRGAKCDICKITKWCKKPVPLILDHINGNYEDNDLTNLRLVCGNCDMQLDTYKSKNIGNGRYYRRQRYAEGKSF